MVRMTSFVVMGEDNSGPNLRQSGRDEAPQSYLNRGNASYLRLEHDRDPFEGATGYHRMYGAKYGELIGE
jgi:hypothetical protein